jgi:hypothetical protein
MFKRLDPLPLFQYADRRAPGPGPDRDLELAQRSQRKPTTAERWAAFHRANPRVFAAIHDIADDMRKAGRRRIGMKAIFELLRADPTLQTSGKPFKLNNTYAPYYARELVRLSPVFEGLIEMRDQKVDPARPGMR